MRIALSLLAVTIGGMILFASLVRAGWEGMMVSGDNNNLKTEPICFDVLKPGGLGRHCYKVPGSLVLPGQITHQLKKARDSWWYFLAGNDEDKFKISLLIADKRMGEVVLMRNKDVDKKMIMETVEEGIGWLFLANTFAKKVEFNNQINEASLAYSYVIETLKEKREINDVEYLQLIKKLKQINDQSLQES